MDSQFFPMMVALSGSIWGLHQEHYETMLNTLKDVDLTKIEETEDNTILDQAAYAGGACEILTWRNKKWI